VDQILELPNIFAQEKAKWEEEVFGSFDADTGDLLTESRWNLEGNCA